MREKCVFQIRPVSLEEGFELTCPELLAEPMRAGRIIETVVLATSLGGNRDFEIQIFDADGERSDVVELIHEPVLAD